MEATSPCDASPYSYFESVIVIRLKCLNKIQFAFSCRDSLCFPVALSYSVQIMDDGVIPVATTDIPVDALVTPSGLIPISPAAIERCH